MKIKTRNNIITFFMFISLAVFLTLGILCGIQIYSGNFHIPENNPYMIMQKSFLTRMNFQAVVISIFILILYSFAFFLYLNISFEKTQSTEIIYFSLFLTGCLVEGIRILFPLMNLWTSSSISMIFITKILLLARFFSPLCLLFLVIYSSYESRQYVEQNVVILFFSAAGGAICCPLNTNSVLPIGYIQTGLQNQFFFLRIIILLIALISLIIKTNQAHLNHKYAIGFAFLIIGYLMLIQTYNFALLFSGTAFLISGTILFLKDLHSQYLWN